jgi:hypothetical protein
MYSVARQRFYLDLAFVLKRFPIGVLKEVGLDCYIVLSGILLEILSKTTETMSGKCRIWESFKPGTSRIQNGRIIAWTNLKELLS